MDKRLPSGRVESDYSKFFIFSIFFYKLYIFHFIRHWSQVSLVVCTDYFIIKSYVLDVNLLEVESGLDKVIALDG